jgi:succinyl-CoA:acetate CoA-transferase
MTVGMSGFTRAGDAQAVPAGAGRTRERAKAPLKITLMTGASLGNDTRQAILTEAGVLARRMPFQVDPTARGDQPRRGDVHRPAPVRNRRAAAQPPMKLPSTSRSSKPWPSLNTGAIVPTTSVGNSASFAILADKVIVEINLAQPPASKACTTSISRPTARREPIPLDVEDRIGSTAIEIPPEKIVAIVITEQPDSRPPSCRRMSDTTRSPAPDHFLQTRSRRRAPDDKPAAAAGGHRHHRQRGDAGLIDSPFST